MRLTRRVVDIPMSKVRLKRARVVAVVGQLKAASVTEHVSMRLDAQIGYDGCPFNHTAESWRRSGAPRT